MVKRYNIDENSPKIQEVTLVMRWRAGQVTFDKYHGKGLTLDTLPAPDYEWITPTAPPAKDLSAYVPAPACQRFHINLWLGNYIGKAPSAPHNGPTDEQDVTVLIKNFEFKKP